MRQQHFHPRQCTAQSKRSGERCRNYAMKNKSVCKFHGGKSRRGVNHPCFRHGRRTRDNPNARLAELLNRPTLVLFTVYLYPKPMREMPFREMTGNAKKKYIVHEGDLRMQFTGGDYLSHDEWARLLRRIRREITRMLNELRNG